MGVIDSIITTADRVVAAITPGLNRLVAAVIILFIGFILGKVIGKILEKFLRDLRVDDHAKRMFKRQIGFERGISVLVSFLIYFIAVIMALNALGVTTVVLTILFAVVIITFGISFLLGIKDWVPNIMGGIRVRQRDVFTEGETIAFNGIEGKVEEFTLTETRLRRQNGDLLIVPNNIFTKTTVMKKAAKKRKVRK